MRRALAIQLIINKELGQAKNENPLQGRSKIQEESLHYESQKHTGELPIIGVNTFLSDEGSPTIIPDEVIRATTEEKEFAISSRKALQERNAEARRAALEKLQGVALAGGNIFEELMETVKCCTLGDITGALYEVGGRYRRNM